MTLSVGPKVYLATWVARLINPYFSGTVYLTFNSREQTTSLSQSIAIMSDYTFTYEMKKRKKKIVVIFKCSGKQCDVTI